MTFIKKSLSHYSKFSHGFIKFASSFMRLVNDNFMSSAKTIERWAKVGQRWLLDLSQKLKKKSSLIDKHKS